MAEADSSTVGDSLEPDSASPTPGKPFSLVDSALDAAGLQWASGGGGGGNLRHLTKGRAGLPQRRPPSRFRGDEEARGQKAQTKRLKSESNANASPNQKQVEDLFHPNDAPVTV